MNRIYELLTANQSFGFIVLCIYVGFLVGCILALYAKRTLGNFIRKLLSMDATSKEKAVTLKECGFEKKGSVVRALRGKGAFAGLVYEASEEVEFDREDHALPIYREDFDRENGKFYIPFPLKYRADVRFERKGTHIMAVVAAAIGFAVLASLCILYQNEMMKFIASLIESAKNI